MGRRRFIVGSTDRLLRRRRGMDTTRRRTPGRAWALETLEDRVVPATITVTNLDDSGVGTLRAAIEQANSDAAQNTIDFAPSVTGTISLSSALPDLSADTILDGPGASVLTVARNGDAGTPAFRIFTVPAGAVVAITGLTVAGGRGDVTQFGTLTVTLGGGIANSGTLTVANCTISGNSAAEFGGGISNLGTLTVTNCTISGNSAGGRGGGIENGGTLSVTDSTISGNSAAFGGGIEDGGILSFTLPTTRFTLALTNCTISGNSASSDAGGIDDIGNPGATLSVTNCTISGNSGGVGVGGIECASTLTVTYCTISDNSGEFGGGLRFGGQPSATLTVTDSLFSGNLGFSLAVASDAVYSLSHDLFSDAPDVALDSTNLINTDPLLGPLAANGGPTLTQALLPGSPAIDAGVPVAGVTTDQRGVLRPQGPAPDIGAFEGPFEGPIEFQGPRIVSLHRFGVHREPTTLVLTFSEPLDSASAESRANYHLVWAGPDHRLGTKDDRVIRIHFIRYDPARDTVRLRPLSRLPLRRTFWLKVVGTPPGGLTNTTGVYLGGDYLAAINRKSLVWPQSQGGHDRAGLRSPAKARITEHLAGLRGEQD